MTIEEQKAAKLAEQWPKICGKCSRQYVNGQSHDKREWEDLENVKKIGEFELRNCICGTTLCALMKVLNPEEE